MQASCTLTLRNSMWSAAHSSATLGSVEVVAPSRDEVLQKMQDELQYRIELCPCSGVSGDTVVLHVSESGGMK